MQITKITKGPAYDSTLGWLLAIGEVEKVKGAFIGCSGGSCSLTPQIASISGNVLQVQFKLGTSGALLDTSATSTWLTGTDFMVLAEGY